MPASSGADAVLVSPTKLRVWWSNVGLDGFWNEATSSSGSPRDLTRNSDAFRRMVDFFVWALRCHG